MAKIITTAIIKGGTGKTTTAAALAQAAAFKSKKVLAIDLDPQCNLSHCLAANSDGLSSFDLLEGEDPAACIVQSPQGFDVIPASSDLATVKTRPGSAQRLRNAIKPIIDQYDYIFIDTPPQMGELAFNALQASTGLLIPLEAEGFGLQGLYQIIDIARQMQESNPELEIMGAVICRYDKRANLSKFFYNSIAEAGEEAGAPLLMAIRKGIAIIEAQSLQLSLFDYAPHSKQAKDYLSLFEIIDKL